MLHPSHRRLSTVVLSFVQGVLIGIVVTGPILGPRLSNLMVQHLHASTLAEEGRANRCSDHPELCRWRSQGQAYADCPVDLGYGCSFPCATFWCASASPLDRGNQASGAVAPKDICTVVGDQASPCPLAK